MITFTTGCSSKIITGTYKNRTLACALGWEAKESIKKQDGAGTMQVRLVQGGSGRGFLLLTFTAAGLGRGFGHCHLLPGAWLQEVQTWGFCSQAGQMVPVRGAAGSACRCPAGEGHYFVTDMPRSLRGAKSKDKLPVILLAFHCWQVFLTLQLLGVTQGYIHLQLNHINKTTPVRCRLYSRCRKSKCLSKCTLIYQ